MNCNHFTTSTTRRGMLQSCAGAFGHLAMMGMLGKAKSLHASIGSRQNPLSPVPAHFVPRAKRIIFLVTGDAKAAILREFRNDPLSLPSGIATAEHDTVEIWTDLSPEAVN